jgi:hypothetical protein
VIGARARAIGCAIRAVNKLDPGPVFSDGHRRDSQLVGVQGGPLDRPALVGDGIAVRPAPR